MLFYALAVLGIVPIRQEITLQIVRLVDARARALVESRSR